MNKNEDDDAPQESLPQREDDRSEDDNSDNDSVDSAQLLADITDVLNSSDLEFSGTKDPEKSITVSYLDKGHSAAKPSDEISVKREIIQDAKLIPKLETVNPSRDFSASSHNGHNMSIKSEIKCSKRVSAHKRSSDLSCSSENHHDAAGTLVQDITPQNLKKPVVCLTRLDPSLIAHKMQPSNNTPGSTQYLSSGTEVSSRDRKARKKTEIKKSAWHDEDSSCSDISVSDVSDVEEESRVSISVSAAAKSDPDPKLKGIKEKPSKIQEKNPKSNSSHHKVRDKDMVSEEKKGMATPLSSQKPKSVHSNQTSSSSQSKKSTPSGVKITNLEDKSKVNEMSSKSTDKDRKITEKSKTTILTDSRKRRLSKDDRGTDPSSQSSLKHQKVTSSGAKKGGDLKHQDVSLVKDKNQKISSAETKKNMDILQLSNWRYELNLSPVDIGDLSNESFRKFINLASDCAINFDSRPKSHPIAGHVNLYFGTAPQMQSGMQKLCQLSLMPPKIIQGIIKCRHIQKVDRGKSDLKWTYTEEVKLGFSMYSTWTEKVKQLVQSKDWKREDETKRKFAQVQRIPPIVSKEMISLLFPFSHNVHISKPNAGDQKKDSSGHTSVAFENTALMETMLSCFRDFYIAKSGNGNPVWKLGIMNFTPRPEKIPARSVTAIQGDAAMRNRTGPKTPANPTSRDKSKDFTTPKHSDRYQSKSSKESSWGKGDSRKRPFPAPGITASGGGSEKKRRQSEGISSVSSGLDQTEGPSSQNAETDKSNLRTLAQLKGLDPNNVDVLRILEVQSQLTSLQALFSCSPMEDSASNLHMGDNNDPEKFLNSKRADRLTTSANASITEAEKQLRENIASKQKQLKELEAKLQQKRHVRKDVLKDKSQSQFDASRANLAASLNDEPLDFTKPAPKIEEAVKKDEERSKMFASSSSKLPFVSQQSKGKRDKQKELAFKEEDFALPLQFGKNVSKAAIKEIVHQNDRQTRGREDSHQSGNKSSHQKSGNEQRPFSKGSASNVPWNQRKQKTNFDNKKPADWTRQGESKERHTFGSNRSLVTEGNEGSKSKRNPFQENFRPGQNRMHQNSGGSHSKSFLPKETGNERYPGEGQRSHNMLHEKMWQENFHVEPRQFPGSRLESGSEERGVQPGRNELSRLNPTKEYWNEFEDADYNKGVAAYHGNRQDNAPFFRGSVQHEKYNPLRNSSEPIGAGQRNLQAYPRESIGALFDQRNQRDAPRALFDQRNQQETSRALFDQRNQQAAPGESSRALFDQRSQQETPRALFDQRNQQAAPGESSRALFDQRSQQETPRTLFDQRNQQAAPGESSRALFDQRSQQVAPRESPRASHERQHQQERHFGSAWMEGDRFEDIGEMKYPELRHGDADMTPVYGRDGAFGHEFGFHEGTQRGRGSNLRARGIGARGRGGMEMRGKDHELPESAAAEEMGFEFHRGAAFGSGGLESQRGAGGVRGRGHDPLRSAVAGGRGSELQRGEAAAGRGTEPARGFGTRGRGHEPLSGAAGGGRGSELQRGRGTEPPRGFGTRGRGHEPLRGVVSEGRGSEFEREGAVRGRGTEPPRAFGARTRGHEPQRGAASGGRGIEPPRSLGIGGRGHESQIGGQVDDRDRNMEYPEGLTTRGRGLLLPRGRGAQQPPRGRGLRGRDVDFQGGFEIGELEAEPRFAQNERDSGPLLDSRIRGRDIETQGNMEMFETDFQAQRGYGIAERGRGIQQIPAIVGRDAEPEISTEIEERSFQGGRGAGTRGRGAQGLRGTGMRGRGRGILRGPDMNEGNTDSRGNIPEVSQRGHGMRGRGGHNQRGNGMKGNGRGLDVQSSSMANRGMGLQNANNFADVRGEQSSFGNFGSSEESFHGEGYGGEGGRGFLNTHTFPDVRGERSSFTAFGSSAENFHSGGDADNSFAAIPVLNSNATRGRGQNAERQRERMSQRGRGHSEMHSDDRFEEFARTIENQEASHVNFQRAGNNRGRGRQNFQDDFEHTEMGMHQESSSLNRAGSAVMQGVRGRGSGFEAPPRGGGPPRGRGFGGPPAPDSSDNFGGSQLQPQRGHESGGDFRGRGNFKGGQSSRPRGRGGAPPFSFGRGGTARNIGTGGNNNQNWPGMI